MAQDDMHVVMFKILAYLYDCMKRGEEPRRSMLAHDGDMLSIPYNYWAQVLQQLVDEGLVTGIVPAHTLSGYEFAFDRPAVTLKGVQFLQENSMMRKALNFLKETKSALPFV